MIEKTSKKRYSGLGEIVAEAAELLRPKERLTTAQASEKYVYIDQPGAYTGFYKNSKAPYMVEPMNNLKSRLFTSVVFCGPAQCGKTQSLLINWLASTVMTQPMDMILYSPTQSLARDFSIRRIDRLHDKGPIPGEKSAVGQHLLKDRDADNKSDKRYDNGMILTMSWPTKNTLAGRPVGLVGLTDYDRMDDDIEGDGDAFGLASKRTTTFKSFGMTMAESSPSRPIEDKKWIRKTPHESPPCKGILGLYNAGDRRRWYWPCPKCGNHFVGNFKQLEWDRTLKNTVDASETVRLRCPDISCNTLIHPDQRYEMNLAGQWLADGQSIDLNGRIDGEAVRSQTASYWLDGTAAAFITWSQLIINFIEASKDFDRTGSEDKLRKFYNNDLAEPYVEKSDMVLRLPETLMSRAEALGSTQAEPTVPEGVRFLVSTVDVQKNMFKCQVHGIMPGEPFDMTIIDRFDIRLNAQGRKDNEGQIEWVKPGAYVEDWFQIVDKVIERTYPLADGSGRRMGVKITGCDSGGRAGVTATAYQFYRHLRTEGKAGRFHLIKGTGLPGAPRAQITYPDSNRRDTKAAAQGDVPVLMLQSNQLKDMLSNRLETLIPGKGMIRFPDWLPTWFYSEMTSEVRGEKGWTNNGNRNEAWDLCYYALGLCVSALLKAETYDWNKPPVWAAEWASNPFVTAPDAPLAFANVPKRSIDFAKLAADLA